MWEYYSEIRPFKKGAAQFAIKNDKPILPMAFTYRKPNWIRRKILKQIAVFDLHIGEPILVDKSLEKGAQVDDMTVRTHEAVVALAGKEKSIYPPIYDHSKRIDE